MKDLVAADRVLRTSQQVDERWYLERYPDVKLLGMSAVEHYAWIGKRLGRLPSEVVAREPVARLLRPEAQLDALFVDGANGTTSTTYRVQHVARGLQRAGLRVARVRGDELATVRPADVRADYVVFFRSPFWTPYREFAEEMRRLGATIVYDVDDLVFDEDAMDLMDGNRFLSPDDLEQYRRGIRAYREFVEYSDVCTLSTQALADEVRRLGKEAGRVRNTISAKNLSFFSRLPARSVERPSPFVIGYYSGTKTHQADFAKVAGALSQFMSKFSDVYFRCVGQLDLGEFPGFEPLEGRIIRVGLMPHDAMLRDQTACDVIIAPLDVGNAFCEAKSELKFFEAALVKCPVIASPTRSFREATENGRYARLALTPADWLSAFEQVYFDYKSAVRMAEAAYGYVVNEYVETVAAREWMEACLGPLRSVRRRDPDDANRAADVAVLITDVLIGGGGHRKVFKICEALEQEGFSVRIYVLYSDRPEELIRSEIRTHFYAIEADVVHFRGAIDEHTFVICTHWTTAYEYRKLRHQGEAFYFVQDFEPLFHAAGSDQARALSTYTAISSIVCYGRWAAAKLGNELGLACASIPFTLDHSNYAPPDAERDRDIDILLFARPSQERRCFSLVIEGLRELKARAPHIKVGLFGEPGYDALGFDFVSFGLLTEPARLAELYRRSKVGICFSTTNPSQLGYEMVACGAILVDVAVQFHELNFGGDDFVAYCQGAPESIAQVCLDLLANEAELYRRRQRAYDFTSRMPPDDELGTAFIKASGLDLKAAAKMRRHRA